MMKTRAMKALSLSVDVLGRRGPYACAPCIINVRKRTIDGEGRGVWEVVEIGAGQVPSVTCLFKKTVDLDMCLCGVKSR